ncbi:MAG: MarR family winged helix-turn-helix transcriptional regulator [Methylococcaceae bacterium]|jgi:DNA-binding MarR family transcriptional regulator
MYKSQSFKLMERINLLMRTEERKKYAALGLQPIHGQVLDYLSHCNQYSDTPASVTEYMGLTKGTVSQSIQLLERKGYIARQVDSEDGRIMHLSLTPTGEQLLHAMTPEDVFADAEHAVRSNKFSTLTDALQAILMALLKASHGRTFGECHSCIRFTVVDNHYLCGLTEQPLTWRDSEKICRDHAMA